jgi:hypothetical protein
MFAAASLSCIKPANIHIQFFDAAACVDKRYPDYYIGIVWN